MKTQNIINKLEKSNYKVTKSMSGKVVVTPPTGLTKAFSSYNEAYRYFFN